LSPLIELDNPLDLGKIHFRPKLSSFFQTRPTETLVETIDEAISTNDLAISESVDSYPVISEVEAAIEETPAGENDNLEFGQAL
jgi:hypothetical protein